MQKCFPIFSQVSDECKIFDQLLPRFTFLQILIAIILKDTDLRYHRFNCMCFSLPNTINPTNNSQNTQRLFPFTRLFFALRCVFAKQEGKFKYFFQGLTLFELPYVSVVHVCQLWCIQPSEVQTYVSLYNNSFTSSKQKHRTSITNTSSVMLFR